MNSSKHKSILTFIFSVLTLSAVFGQTWTGSVLELNDPVFGSNGDYTAIYRADVVGDRTRLRIRMGDEVTSDLEIGYHLWSDGNWYTTFSVDGYGNSYTRGYVGIGTNTLTERLNVNGKIVAEEVKVMVDVPADYVFDKNYTLRPLAEVEKYVSENNHLPGVPSAAEIKENGWQLGEMSNRMLEKIEELTLYIIDQNKRLETLENLNSQLSNEVKLLKNEKQTFTSKQ